MNFYRITSALTLHSFKDPIGAVPILGISLKKHQEIFISLVNGKLIDIDDPSKIKESGEYFVFADDLFFSIAFLKKAIVASKNKKSSLQFCLDKNIFNERYILPHPNYSNEKYQFKFFYYKNKEEPKEHIIEQNIYEYSVNIPSQIVAGGKYRMDMCDTFASHIISPFHLLFTTLAQNLCRIDSKQKKIPRFLKENFGSPGTFWYYRALRKMNKFGKNCKIHPTAIIEGSEIGDNVFIGANAVIRLSVLKNNCTVSDNVGVINSFLDEGTYIANCNYINSCVTYREVFLIHGPYQLSIFGENSACFAVINCDIRLDQNTIKIPTSYGIIDSKQPILGIAYGHRSKAGGGNIIASGRIMPNDYVLNPPDSIILNFEKK